MYFIEFLYAITFLIAFRYLRVLQLKNAPLWVMPLSFCIKIGVTIVFLLMYLHPDTNNNVPSDTMRFLSESKKLHTVFYTSPKDYFSLLIGVGDEHYLIQKYLNETFLWDSGSMTIVNDSRNIIRLHSLIQFVSFGSPFIHGLLMCFIALIGLKNLHYAFIPFIHIKPYLSFFILLLLPGALFWTSGILKEPILLLGIGLLMRSTLSKENIKHRIVTGTISVLILVSIKPYVLSCLIPAFTFYILYKYVFKQRMIVSLLSFFVIGLTVVFLFKNERQKVVHYISMKQYDFSHIGKGGLFVKADTNLFYFNPKQFKNLIINKNKTKVKLIHSTASYNVSRSNMYPPKACYIKAQGQEWKLNYYVGGALSYIEPTLINNSFSQLIKNIPEALTNSYARPFPSDPGSGLKYPAMFEVWGLTFFIIYALSNRRKINTEIRGLIVSLFIFSLSLLLILGWTTPIIGAIYRYRFPAQLALLIIALLLMKSLPFIKNSESKEKLT